MRFSQILSELSDLHRLKTSEYGTPDDPFANIREASDPSEPVWISAISKATYDIVESTRAAQGSETRRAAVVSLLNDAASYAIIARILYEEEFPEVAVEHTWEGQPAQTS